MEVLQFTVLQCREETSWPHLTVAMAFSLSSLGLLYEMKVVLIFSYSSNFLLNTLLSTGGSQAKSWLQAGTHARAHAHTKTFIDQVVAQ